MDDPDMDEQQTGRDPSANWSSRNSPYAADDHITSYSPYLPPVLEEPSSSFSEGDRSTLSTILCLSSALRYLNSCNI